MGRLIDADALLKMKFSNGLNQDGLLYVPYSEVMRNIKEQPTAYDPEKVVEDLQKASMIVEQNENNIKCAIEENMAVYIVKRGGVE